MRKSEAPSSPSANEARVVDGRTGATHPAAGLTRLAQRIAGGSLINSTAVLALAAILAPLASLVYDANRGGGLWNDFASYWLAGKLVAAGRSPYDLIALARFGHREGISFQPGTGYSYPLPFALAMVPLGALPFTLAASVFSAGSLLVFGLGVAAWLRDGRVFRATPPVTVATAFFAGLYPPVTGSVFFGQANLLVFGALVLGVRHLVRGGSTHGFWGGAWIGLGGIVKVAPLALLVPSALAGHGRAVLGICVAAAGTSLVALAVASFAASGMERLGGLLVSDPYWTNQSLNGLVSRLTMRTERTVPPLPHGDPVVLGWFALGLLALATLVVLFRAQRALAAWPGFALALGLTLVAVTVGAPKNSFWNHVPALIGAGLLLSAGVVTNSRLNRLAGFGLVAWFLGALAQRWVNGVGDSALRALGPASALVSSVAVYGLLVLWLALAAALMRLSDDSESNKLSQA